MHQSALEEDKVLLRDFLLKSVEAGRGGRVAVFGKCHDIDVFLL